MTADTVLIVTASYDVAADYILKSLRQMGTPAFRLNTDHFPSHVKAFFRPPKDIEFMESANVTKNEIYNDLKNLKEEKKTIIKENDIPNKLFRFLKNHNF